MRYSAFFLMLFLLGACSREKDSKDSNLTTELSDPFELVFLDDIQFKPFKLGSGNCPNPMACAGRINGLKIRVQKHLKDVIKLPKDIHVQNISVLDNKVSVLIDGVTKQDSILIQSYVNSNSSKFETKADIEIQGRRPMMQAELIPQGRRPMMQEQLRYDSLNQTSKFIQLIRGGVSNFPGKSQRVWIVDTGIDKSHPDISFDSSEVALSKSFAMNANDPFVDSDGHGTFIAGIIGAKSNPPNLQEYHMNGVYPGAKMVSLKVFDNKGKSTENRVKNALEYILLNGASGDIVNLSLGQQGSGPNFCTSGKIKEKIEALVDFGINVVMSAGNEAEPSDTNFPGCINYEGTGGNTAKTYTVGSVEVLSSNSVLFSFFSNYDVSETDRIIDYLEPGEYIFTTGPLKADSIPNYTVVSGTSFSAAIFSGILYGNPNPVTWKTVQRGAASGEGDPVYIVGKLQ
ncbi:Subtilase family protein [Algoriphagus ornithinivorans]|uniref:Subtilase family protein n=1 Tax=Algoriphagus ornithinivorans TaxID=226506 RepID=A0A1I5H569_9BACT|nr:S8/S53 family peptidase [Algoriphagus ornithinivorans]SFO43458.1 Subtilase family protein [Algoriphagus ornithinivorans]